MHRPKFKDKYHIEPVDDAVFLLAERDSFVLEGPSMARVVPLIDGIRSSEEIVAAAWPTLQPNDVSQALNLLNQAGHLVESDPGMPAVFAAFWSELNVDTRIAVSILSSHSIAVSAIGPIDATPLIHALRAFGIRVEATGSVQIAVVDDYLRPELAELNRQCLARGVPLLLVKPVGLQLWIGPLVLPGQTACWRCLESRLRGNREVESFVERKSGKSGPFPIVRARVGIAEHQAYSMLVTQLVRWLVTGRNAELESRLLVADLINFSFSFHQIVKRPQCPDCGDPALGSTAGQRVDIRDFLAPVDTQGGLRSEPPEQTFARFEHHISSLSGVVKAVTPSIWHGAGPIRTYVAGHNFALKSDQLYFLKDGLRTQSSGKGRTDAQARTSALCEALERYSGVYRGDEPRITGSLAGLGELALDPRDAMLYSASQYENREAWLARNSRFQVVPLPFREDAMLEWTPLWSLTRGRQRYLPTSYLYYNYPSRPEQFYCWADSNGCAAGTTLEDAMLQGLLELVERDAVAIWWYNRLRYRAIDLDAYDDGYISEMRAFYYSQSRDFWVLNITSDLGIPAFVAISRRFRGPTEDIMMGFGAHLDTRIAINRAMTELNQFIPALLGTNPDGTTHYALGDVDALNWWQNATIDNQPYLLPAEGSAPFRPDEAVPMPEGGVGTLLRGLVDKLEGRGHEVLMLDQTRPDVGLPVVKMVVPGLRHFWARFAPGRLYDVPVQMGHLQQPLAEAELNPIPMFL